MKRESDVGSPRADRDWIAAIGESYRPEPMSAWQRTSFDAKLSERLHEHVRVRRNWLAVAVSAAAALVLWFGTIEVDRPPTRQAATDASDSDAAMPIVYAFVTPEQESATLLPDDYIALADVLGIESDTR